MAKPSRQPTNSRIEIDNDVPMPAARLYPWDDLEIGQSFVVLETANGAHLSSLVSLAGSGNQRYTPKHFISRTIMENGIKGVRIWRDK